LADCYDAALAGVDGLRLPPRPAGVEMNYSYYPVMVEGAGRRDHVYSSLKASQILSRRYFYPLISDFPAYRHLSSAEPGRLPMAKKVAEEVLCLPIYPDLPLATAAHIAGMVKASLVG